MSVQDGSYMYKLVGRKKPTYSINGETKKAEFLEIREPGMSHMGKLCRIKQAVNGLLLVLQEKNENRSDDLIAGEEVKKFHEQDLKGIEEQAEDLAQMLEFAFGASRDIKMDHVINDFRDMACNTKGSSICVVDGTVAMTDVIWQTLDPVDAIGVALRWCAFFTMPSEFLKKTGLDDQSELPTEVKEL